ncbi:MAG: hypothetical protein K2G03_07205 [Bacilli bacterium]|nr:hypothetical protein [Bacilli bacterium]MDE6142376.1 hypothetical protein [Bacilli bacterium]
MKKNGFIATSILYSFFLIFITLFVALITNYLHNQVLISALDEASWDILMGINNTKISDLQPGDRVRFANNSNVDSQIFLNEDTNWVVAYVQNRDANTKIYYFFSDIHTPKSTVYYKMNLDKFAKIHTLSIDVADELFKNANKPYNKSLKFNNKAGNPTIDIGFVTSSILNTVRNQNYSVDIADAIFNAGGAYAVKVNSSITGYTSGQFYNMKMYTFPLGSAQSNLLTSYCGGSFDGSRVTYNVPNVNVNNAFGYMHIMDDATKGNNYIDYCFYASPIAYNHNARDLVVTFDERNVVDLITATFSSQYNIRLMATVTVNVNANNTYIAGGRGTSMDPYLITDGVKVG